MRARMHPRKASPILIHTRKCRKSQNPFHYTSLLPTPTAARLFIPAIFRPHCEETNDILFVPYTNTLLYYVLTLQSDVRTLYCLKETELAKVGDAKQKPNQLQPLCLRILVMIGVLYCSSTEYYARRLIVILRLGTVVL